MKPQRIVLTGGGTGGHIYPAIAVANALKLLNPKIEILFVGAKRPLDEKILKAQPYAHKLIAIGPVNSSGFVNKMKALLQIPLAFLAARKILKEFKADFVLGFGGYASAPSLFMSRMMGIHRGVWEGNAFPGLVTRKMAKKADFFFLNFEDQQGLFDKAKTFVYGVPVRLLPRVNDRVRCGRLRILVTGGSSGARGINLAVAQWVEDIWVHNKYPGFEMGNVDIVHQVGGLEYLQFKNRYQKMRAPIDVRDFIYNMEEEYAKADLVICRAGAGTVAEVALMQKAAIFVPLPTAADNHQFHNAQRLVEKEAALMIEQKDLNSDILTRIVREFLANPKKISVLEDKIRKFQTPDSARKIAEKILEYNP